VVLRDGQMLCKKHADRVPPYLRRQPHQKSGQPSRAKVQAELGFVKPVPKAEIEANKGVKHSPLREVRGIKRRDHR
jgi:hypothetical protein